MFSCFLTTWAESSDDSYVSAGEDPMEAPVFEFPLHDVAASTGVEVVLKCVIAGTPLPEGKSVLLPCSCCVYFHSQKLTLNLHAEIKVLLSWTMFTSIFKWSRSLAATGLNDFRLIS